MVEIYSNGMKEVVGYDYRRKN